MSLGQRFERRLEGLVGGAFARVFKGQVEPVEIGTALQREAADKRNVMGNEQVLSPNRYRVTLSPSDYERLLPWESQLCNSLAELVQEYLDENRWETIGDIEVYLAQDDQLHTGVFGVASRMESAAPPRRRPHDSLSLPIIPGMEPGEYAPQEQYDQFAQQNPYLQDPNGQGQYAPPDAYQPPYPQQDYPQQDYPQQDYPQQGQYGANPYQQGYPPNPYQPQGGYQPVGAGAVAPGQYGAPGPGYGNPYGDQPPNQPQYQQPAAPAPALIVDQTNRRYDLRVGSNVIGRGTDSDLQLLDQGISRRHADIQFDGNWATAYDLGSTNGTTVNGHEISSQLLRHGDVVRVGHTRIVFHQERQ